MSCDLTNGRLLEACSLGRSGIKTLYFTKFNDFDALTGVIELDGEITDLGADPITIYQFNMSDNVGNFDEALTTAKDNGTSFVTQVVTITLLNIKPADLANLNNLKRGRWAIWALDFQNKIRLFGRLRGCIASGGSDVSGVAPGDKKGLDLILTAVENSYAIFMEDYSVVPFDNFANVTVVAEAAFNAEYQAVYDAMTSKPIQAIAIAQNTMVATLISAGVWAKLDAFYLFAQHTNAASEALINWLNPGTYDATAVSSPAFVALEGFTGDGSLDYINTNLNPGDGGTYKYLLDDSSGGVYSRSDVQEDAYEFGARDGANRGVTMALYFTGGSFLYSYANSDNPGNYVNSDSLGMYVTSRNNSADFQVYKNSVEIIDETETSILIPNYDIYALGQNNAGSLLVPSTKQLSCLHLGGSLTPTEITALTNAVEAYMDSNGKGVIP